MTQKNVLIISPEPWSHIFVSKHHYALELSKKGYNVYFLNPPDTDNFKELTLHKLNNESAITIIDYPGQIKGLRFLPSFIRIYFNQVFLSKLERLIKCKIDVIWNFENSRFFNMQFAQNRLKIYHQVDLNQDFHVKEAAHSADICFCTTDSIKEKIRSYNNKVFKIHHGVSFEAFSGQIPAVRNEQPVATLVGNLDSYYLDIELLVKLVIENYIVRFILVGGYDKNGTTFKLLSAYPNVQFVGKVESSDIKKYLVKSDVLLVCYKSNEFKEQLASPHKMMEYLASGKVIVATYTDEYKDKVHLLEMVNSNEEYAGKFKEVVNNLSNFNNSVKQAERISFAKEHLYSRQLEKINELLKEQQLPVIE